VIRRNGTAPAGLARRELGDQRVRSPAARQQSSSPSAEELSPGELRVLRYLPTNLSQPEIAGELTPAGRTR
jgi:LuxR family maltose regulon positive regulatory protein